MAQQFLWCSIPPMKNLEHFELQIPLIQLSPLRLRGSYSEVTPMALPTTDLRAPEVPQALLTSPTSLSNENEYDEEDWLNNAQELVAKDKLQPRDFVSWSAYRASQSSLSSCKPAIISLLPMFVENACDQGCRTAHQSPTNSSYRIRPAIICPGQTNPVDTA